MTVLNRSPNRNENNNADSMLHIATPTSIAKVQPAIEMTNLTVAYGERPVLWDVDLNVPPGTLMAIVGPNGAGKTTLIKAILGLLPIAAGQVLIYGQPYSEQRRLVGYVPQRGSVDWDFPTR